ncbi:MAG TPA: MFS transporter [Candidatus Binataceae bacterium]|nr:MFS transporter [Candidatus Binataceae bacterium]
MRQASKAIPDSPYAWLTVGLAFISIFAVFGIYYSFGVFLKPMAVEFGASRARTAMLFATTGVVFCVLGPVAGHLSDRISARVIMAAGATAMAIGLVSTAFINGVWIGCLTYGIGVGLGAACVYVPVLTVVGGWFIRRRGAALGIAAAGSGCGMLGVAPLAAVLVERFGWRTADIVLGVASGALLLICIALIEPAPISLSPTKQKLGRTMRSPAFLTLYFSYMLARSALFVPLVYLPAFARDHGASPVAAGALLSLIGGAGIVGRVAFGAMGDRVGIVRLFKTAILAMGASYALWFVLAAYGCLAMFAIAVGLAYGGASGLLPGVVIELFGIQGLGAALGGILTSVGVASLLGPLLAGFLIDRTGSYQWAIAFALLTGIASFAALLSLRPRPTAEHLAAASAG